MVSTDPYDLEGVFDSIVELIGDAIGRPAAPVPRPRTCRKRLAKVPGSRAASRVMVLEWTDPPFAPGHWIPEMVDARRRRPRLGIAGTRRGGRPGRTRSLPPRPDRVGALRLRPRRQQPLTEDPPTACRACRSGPSTPTAASRARARGWWTASRCWRRSCTRRDARSRPAASTGDPPRGPRPTPGHRPPGRLAHQTSTTASSPMWAAECAEHVLRLFETQRPDDARPRKAIDAARTWASRRSAAHDGDASDRRACDEARRATCAAHPGSPPYAAGQAAVVAHVAEHDLGAAAYAIKAAVAAAPPSVGRGVAACRVPVAARPPA